MQSTKVKIQTEIFKKLRQSDKSWSYWLLQVPHERNVTVRNSVSKFNKTSDVKYRVHKVPAGFLIYQMPTILSTEALAQ